jgi:AcrR family transcriptional regulator
VLFIDYAQRITVPGADRITEVATIARGLKNLARNLHIPVVSLAQVKAAVDTRPDKRPTAGDLANSDELTREAARLFAERGFHGTSMDALAQALGVQKGSLYSLTGSKQELLFETMRGGADAFHAALDAVPEDASAIERVCYALRGHLRVVAEQLDVATVFTREWRYLEGEHRDEIVAERRRYEERWRELFRDGVERGELRADLKPSDAALLVLSAANWAYTWLQPGVDTGALADRFTAIVVDGIGGYATPA